MLRNFVIITIIFMFTAAAYAQQSEIEQTKRTEINGYQFTDTGRAFDNFFMNTKWDVLTANNGTKTVVFKGVFKSNPYKKYLDSTAYENLPAEKYTELVESLYPVAYNYGMRESNIFGNDKSKSYQILNYLSFRTYKVDSSIEVYFQLLNDGKSYWVKEYKCDTCPSKDVNDLYALVLDGVFASSPSKAKNYTPASVSAVVPKADTPTTETAPRIEVKTESYADKKLANTTKIAMFGSLEGETAYFDIGKGEQPFAVSPRLAAKVQAIKKNSMVTISFDTVQQYANGSWVSVYTLTDVK